MRVLDVMRMTPWLVALAFLAIGLQFTMSPLEPAPVVVAAEESRR